MMIIPPYALISGLNLVIVRLQTGMRGAFGKPQGTVARVHIGQVIMSVRTKAQNKEHVVEALRRAKFKFPGRQKVNKHVACLNTQNHGFIFINQFYGTIGISQARENLIRAAIIYVSIFSIIQLVVESRKCHKFKKKVFP